VILAVSEIPVITPQVFADLRNQGLSVAGIAGKLGVNYRYLNRLANKWFRDGILLEYYNTALHKLENGVSVAVIAFNQRIPVYSLVKSVEPLSAYYTPLPKPVLILYFEAECNALIEKLARSTISRFTTIALCEKLVNSMIVHEVYSKLSIKLELDRSVGRVSDSFDELIVKTYFQACNPPIQASCNAKAVLEYLKQYMKASTFKNHFYRHVREVAIWKRVLYRPINRDYGILLLQAPCIETGESLISKLAELGLIVGVDIVNMLSTDPFIAILHVWFDPDKVWDPGLFHNEAEYAKYELYVVEKIA